MNTSYIGWQGHTLKTMRELAEEQHQQIANMTALIGASDYLERIEKTPQAWRIYGAIDHFISRGYDADHILKWLEAGYQDEVHQEQP